MSPKKEVVDSRIHTPDTLSSKPKKARAGSDAASAVIQWRTAAVLAKKHEKEDIISSIQQQEAIFQRSSYKNYYENYSTFLARVKRAEAAGKDWKERGMIVIPPVVLHSRFWQLQEAFCNEKDWRVPTYKNRDILDGEAISWLRINPSRIPDGLYRSTLGLTGETPVSIEEKAARVQEIKAFLKRGKVFSWEKLVDIKTHRQHSKENRMYWWNARHKKNETATIENTTCHILELSGDRMPRFFCDAYTAKRETEHIIDGDYDAIEDMETLLRKVKTIRIQIQSIETFGLQNLRTQIREKALRIISPTITILDIFTTDETITRERYLDWKRTQRAMISWDEQLLSDIERYANDKQSHDILVEKWCRTAYESFIMTTGLRTDLGRWMCRNLFKIQELKDSKGNWNPGAFLAATQAALKKIEKRKLALGGQIRAMKEHGIILGKYLERHEEHFHKQYWRTWEASPLPLEKSE